MSLSNYKHAEKKLYILTDPNIQGHKKVPILKRQGFALLEAITRWSAAEI